MNPTGQRAGLDQLALIEQLRQLPLSARKTHFIEFLREQVAGPLGVEPSQIGLRDSLLDLGVDSLKAVEFKSLFEQKLAVPLSSSLLFDYPNLDALAGFLLREAGLLAGPALASVPEPANLPDVLPGDRVAALLAAELEELKRSGGLE